MKQLVCEMCGDTNFVKQDGLFVCQGCGCKYSTEEAKKMISEEPVEVSGTVKIDKNTDIKNLYEAARNATRAGNKDLALSRYSKLEELDPTNWEPAFYVAYWSIDRNVFSCANECYKFDERLMDVFCIISDMKEEKGQLAAVEEIIDTCESYANLKADHATQYYSGSHLFPNGLSKDEREIWDAHGTLLWNLRFHIEQNFDLNKKCWQNLYIRSIEAALEFHNKLFREKTQNLFIGKYLDGLISDMKKYKPDFEYTKKGCYVATCVYGSYDCPEVWTLRRYRDDTLGSTWYGRLFIRTYYAISPTLVKWFGKTNWFKKLWKGTLDRMVTKLQAKGVEDTPYEDKNW